jgi:hypothetical protein
MRARALLVAAAAAVVLVVASASAATPAGRFRVVYAQPRSQAEQTYVELLKASKLEDVVAELSKTLILKRDITIYVAGGVSGPAYFRSRSAITFPHEFSDLLRRFIFAKYPHIKPYDFGVGFASLEYFILVHEIGHALVDQWQLPVLGREEDAVDAFSTIFMTEFVPDGGRIALWAAELFDFLAGHGAKGQSVRLPLQAFADEHSLDEQRAFSIVCWVYGSNPKRYAGLATIPELKSRIPRCVDEYAQLKRSWLKLLRPHIRHA